MALSRSTAGRTNADAAPAQSPDSEAVAARLIGRRLPAVALAHYTGDRIVLAGLRTAFVIYAYPGCPHSPHEGYRSPGEDLAQHHAFAARIREFHGYSCRVIGLSSQPPELQRDANVRHILLSDPELEFARLLGLPTFGADGSDWYQRAVLIVTGGRVAHAVYPVRHPGQSAAHALRWLHTHREQTCRA